LLPRASVINFEDVAIDSAERKRAEKGLLSYVPCYVGFHSWFPGDELNDIFWGQGYHWKFQNHAFFGTLNNVIRARHDANTEYEKSIIFMFRDELIRKFVSAKKARLFDDIAIRRQTNELEYSSVDDFFAKLATCITEKRNGQLETNCEIDLLPDASLPIKASECFECLIVDNEAIREHAKAVVKSIGLNVKVSRLPRGRFVPQRSLK